MKHVFTDISQVAHLWANQLQDSARNSGNYYFNGDSIYSYGSHFRIAKHHVNKKGKSVVLFTTRSYSVTTSKQIAVTRQACSHKDLIFCTNPDGVSHTENFNSWTSRMETEARSLLNARKPEKYLNAIQALFNEAKIYADYFGLKLPKGLILANSITSKEEYIKFNDKKVALAKKEEKQRLANLKKEHAIALEKWRSFELHRMYIRDNQDYLRINTDKQRIQTSQNVEIPFAIAKKFYEQMNSILSNGGCVDCEIKLMDYEVKSIDKKYVVVGCHRVSMNEVNLIASKLNW